MKTTSKAASPWDSVDLISKYFLTFMTPMIKKGVKDELRLEDVWKEPKVDRSGILGKKLEQNYRHELIKYQADASLVRALWNTFGSQLFFICVFTFLAKCVAAPLQSIAIGWIIRDTASYLAHDDDTSSGSEEDGSIAMGKEKLYWFIVYDTVVFIMSTFLSTMLLNPSLFQAHHIGMKMRIASCNLLYKKSLRLSQSALLGTTVGQMSNLLSNDVNRFDPFIAIVPHLLIAPLESIILLCILAFFYIGLYPILATLIAIIISIIIQSLMSKGYMRFRRKIAERTDERVGLINEIILAIRLIKMYVWEKPFEKLVEKVRQHEMNNVLAGSILKIINHAIYSISFDIFHCVGIVTFVLSGNTLTPEIVFVSMGLVNLLSLSLSWYIPKGLSQGAEAYVACKRINTFLNLPEIDANHREELQILGKPSKNKMVGKSLVMKNISCSWFVPKPRARHSIQKEDKPEKLECKRDKIIQNLSLSLAVDDLLLIVGRVGSGKSSVLMSLLGELPIFTGELKVNGRISYASQEAWTFAGSVRENILLDKPFLPERYAEVVRVCALEKDLELLVEGDATIVGERGVSLSGGQRARVNLARALYAQADIYLLDDPLSAVDGPVAKHIFTQGIRGFLSGKTVILATHQLQFLRFATKVLVIDREHPATFGSLQGIMNSESFRSLNYEKDAFEKAASDAATKVEALSKDNSAEEEQKPQVKQLEASKALPNISPKSKCQPSEDKARKKQSSSVECVQTVSVNLATYFFYFKSGAGIFLSLAFLVNVLFSEVLVRGIGYFLTFWTEFLDNQQHHPGARSSFSSNFFKNLTVDQCVFIYLALVGLSVLVYTSRAAIFYTFSYRASIKLHKRLFKSIFYSPMTFFDFNPIGNLLNRLSRDMGFIDEFMPSVAMDLFIDYGDVLSNFVVIVFIDFYNLPTIMMLLIFTIVLRYFAGSTINKLKQMEGATRSTIFSHISTTMIGLPTIRASRAQEKFLQDFDRFQDVHSGVWFSYMCATRWLVGTMDLLCSSFSSSAVVVVLAFSLNSITSSLVGLLITRVLFIATPLQYSIRQLTDVASQMTSVQRIKEFINLEPEEPSARSSALYPFQLNKGEIKFEKVTLNYFPDEPPVLNDISFTVAPGERIGIVGRTGAGKSSIISVLFRLYKFVGTIRLDGTDIEDLSLAQLRSVISIIPQDPVLFSGSLRKNIDPLGKCSDNQLWEALEAVQLKPLFARHPAKLEFIIHEGGSNFSVGQRQLICLARAIVRRNKILVLDEATANVDPETDEFIQKTIGQQFANCTVITIAHRLLTVAKSAKVLVLDQGQVREFAPPGELMQNEKSLFSQMLTASTNQADQKHDMIKMKHNEQPKV